MNADTAYTSPYATRQPRRRAGSGRFLLIALLGAFVLGAAVVGYGMYALGYGGAAVQSEGAPAEVALADDANPVSPSGPLEIATSAPADETPVQAVERVTQQQGGIDQRLAAAEQRLARLDLQAQAAAGNSARAEGLLIAFAARRALERGEDLGLLRDQLRLRFGGAQPNAVGAVMALAREPVTLQQLTSRLDRLVGEMEQREEEEPLVRLRRELGELFVFRRADSASPRPERRVERARLRLQAGDVGRAVREVEELPGADLPAVRSWLEDANRYMRGQQALDVLETTALLEPQRLRDASGDRVAQPSPVSE